jgi:tetratricopeptide (TPR) repeat protein
MRRAFYILILAVLVSCASNDKLIMQSELDKAVFSGKVITEEGLPLEGVKIKLNSSLEARTDINGNFFYTYLAFGKYKIAFERNDYAKEEFDFEYNLKSKRPLKMKLKMFSLNFLLSEGRELMESKKYKDVELIIKKIDSIDQDDESVINFKAVFLFTTSKYAEARSLYEELVVKDRSNVYYHLPLITIYEKLEMFLEEARTCLYVGRNYPDEYVGLIKKSAEIYKDKLKDDAEYEKVMKVYNSFIEKKKK